MSEIRTKIIFLGYAHRPNDARLCHREMRVLQQAGDVECVFFQEEPEPGGSKIRLERKERIFGGVRVHQLTLRYPSFWWNTCRVKRKFNRLRLYGAVISAIRNENADVIQASDVREIMMALLSGFGEKTRCIYDSHEDYYRQVMDYSHGPFKIIKAIKNRIREYVFLRFFDAVFCTDDFLLAEYSKRIYGCMSVQLLRNYACEAGAVKNVENKDMLRLLYIGRASQYRGVLECAEYVERWNKQNEQKKLELHAYGPEEEIARNLHEQGRLVYHGSMDYAELIKRLPDYDIGVCLWHPIKKYYRNLPLKNFDYMSAGLPVITSNFGNLRKYIDESGAGICIDPFSYEQFRDAITRMTDINERLAFSRNGLEWTKRNSFQTEAEPYVSSVLNYEGTK